MALLRLLQVQDPFCLPCMGERSDIWPFVAGGLLLLAAVLVLFLKRRRGKNGDDQKLD